VQNEPNLALLGQGRVADTRKMRNEPNSSIADFGLRIADWDSPAAGRPLRAVGPGAGCTNKPNSRRSNRKGKCVVGKDLW
jgi:hypothetical protein